MTPIVCFNVPQWTCRPPTTLKNILTPLMKGERSLRGAVLKGGTMAWFNRHKSTSQLGATSRQDEPFLKVARLRNHQKLKCAVHMKFADPSPQHNEANPTAKHLGLRSRLHQRSGMGSLSAGDGSHCSKRPWGLKGSEDPLLLDPQLCSGRNKISIKFQSCLHLAIGTYLGGEGVQLNIMNKDHPPTLSFS